MSGVFHLFAVIYQPHGTLLFSDFYIQAENCDSAYATVREQVEPADEVYCSKMPSGNGLIAGPFTSDTTEDFHAAWLRHQDTHKRMK